jgi:hypothetical protein
MQITLKQLKKIIKEEVMRSQQLAESTWLAVVKWGVESEEIEVEAKSAKDARAKIEAELADPAMWRPGGKIIQGPEKVTGGWKISSF